jgi:type VI secretion system secreted protein Hcp
MEYIVLEIPDVVGESTLEGFSQKIELFSYSWGVSNPVQPSPSNTGRTTGRPNFAELVVSKKMDSTSPILSDDCASAKNLGTVKLYLVRQDEAAGENLTYMTYELSNTLISSVMVSGGGDIPTESISFNYSAINWIYKAQKTEAGQAETVARGWDQATNKEAEVSATA